ncbi:MAG: hypothetical protein EBZ66_01675 [Actinobacteria bacterium]|nr:hypothetical protein [Actinomycetota bacterium]
MAEQPMNPLAGASGPGPFAVRTDQLTMPSAFYSEGVETAAIKAGAPLSKTPDVKGIPASQVREAAAQTPITPLFAPTQRPGEDITSGIDIGPGPGSSALGINRVTQKTSDALAKMIPFDTTGEIAILYQQALARGD